MLKEIKYVICIITYPVTNDAIFKFDCSNIDVTYGVIMYLYTYAYQYMYELEDTIPVGNIFGMLNRKKSEGRFGIWGHYIEDLVYNGNSSLKYVNDNETLICEFDCDS